MPIKTSEIQENDKIKQSVTYSVHAGSFSKITSAESEAERFQTMGYNAHVECADLGGKGIWYRVKIGRFSVERVCLPGPSTSQALPFEKKTADWLSRTIH